MPSGSWRKSRKEWIKAGLTLAEATARFEQGMKLVQHCNHLLDKAELEITQLKDSYQRPGASEGFPDSSLPQSFDYPMGDDEEYEEEESLPSRSWLSLRQARLVPDDVGTGQN